MTEQRDIVEITPAMIEAGIPALQNRGEDDYETVRAIVMAVLMAVPAEGVPLTLDAEFAQACQDATP